jgi:hypothetical protein
MEEDEWKKQAAGVSLVPPGKKRRTKDNDDDEDDWGQDAKRMRRLVRNCFDFGERAHAREVARLVRLRQAMIAERKPIASQDKERARLHAIPVAIRIMLTFICSSALDVLGPGLPWA